MRRMFVSRSSLENVEPLRQVLADLVAVEQLDPPAARPQLVDHDLGDRALPGARQPGEPDAASAGGSAPGPWRRRIREARRDPGCCEGAGPQHEILVTLDSDLSGPRDAVWRLRRVRAGPGGLATSRTSGSTRSSIAARSRPGIAVERRRDHHRRQGHGSRHAGLRRAPPRAARRPPRHRSRSLLHHRFEHLAQRAAGVPVGCRSRLLRSATTATSRTPRRSRASSGMLPGSRSRPTAS